MATVSPFLQALGGFFGGYGQDQQNLLQRQRQSALDAQNAQSLRMQQQLHAAQLAGMQGEQASRDAAAKRQAEIETVLASNWEPAISGDRQAQARIVSMRPDLANEFMPKAPPKPNRTVNVERGVIIDDDTGKATPIQGLPPAQREAKAPVMGTPEYYAALKKELEVKKEFQSPEGPKITDFSNKAALLYPKAEQSAKALEKYFTNGAPARALLSRVPLVGNYGLSADEQAMNQAAEAVASAFLRLESGASISESEIKSAAKQFLPQPGDSPEVRTQKRATLQTQLEQMRQAASPSMGSAKPNPVAPSVAPSGAAPRTPAAPAVNDQRQSGRLTPAQVLRASRDPLYKQFLLDTGKIR